MIIAERTDTAVPLTLTLDQEGVGGVVGKAPTVALRDATTLDSYMDWADYQFKTGGWTNKYGSMDEIERGHYTRIFNLSMLGLDSGTFLSVEYHVDDGAEVIGDTSELLLAVNAVYSISPTGTLVEEIHRILGLDPDHPLVVSKVQRAAGGNIVQRIEENVPFAGAVKVTRL